MDLPWLLGFSWFPQNLSLNPQSSLLKEENIILQQSYPILGNESLHCVDQSKLNLLFHTQLVKKSQSHEKCSTISTAILYKFQM